MQQRIIPIPRPSKVKSNWLLSMVGVGTAPNKPQNCLDIQVTEIKGPAVTDICTINLGTFGELFRPFVLFPNEVGKQPSYSLV